MWKTAQRPGGRIFGCWGGVKLNGHVNAPRSGCCWLICAVVPVVDRGLGHGAGPSGPGRFGARGVAVVHARDQAGSGLLARGRAVSLELLFTVRRKVGDLERLGR